MIDWDALVIGPTIATFGEAVTYLPVVGAPFAVVGVYDEAYRDLSILDDSVGITTEVPVLGVQLSQFDVPPAQGDRLTITRTGFSFLVREVRLDGHGWAKLMLNFAA